MTDALLPKELRVTPPSSMSTELALIPGRGPTDALGPSRYARPDVSPLAGDLLGFAVNGVVPALVVVSLVERVAGGHALSPSTQMALLRLRADVVIEGGAAVLERAVLLHARANGPVLDEATTPSFDEVRVFARVGALTTSSPGHALLYRALAGEAFDCGAQFVGGIGMRVGFVGIPRARAFEKPLTDAGARLVDDGPLDVVYVGVGATTFRQRLRVLERFTPATHVHSAVPHGDERHRRRDVDLRR